VPGRVLGIKAEDLDGDKHRDLVVLFGTEKERVIALFFDHHGSFHSQPDQTLVAPKNATLSTWVTSTETASRRSSTATAAASWRCVSTPRRSGSIRRRAGLVEVSSLLSLPEED